MFAVFLSPLEIIYEPLSVRCVISHLILEMKYACAFCNVSILTITFFKQSFPME